jgi:oligopeptide/dipeptide ABC transporter ATP-binding protein
VVDLSGAPLLRVENLEAQIRTRWGVVRAVDGVSFTVGRGETLGLVGESGSGKSMTCLSLVRLLPRGGAVTNGKIVFDGEDLLAKSEREMRRVRGSRISMILQDPMTSLNPVLSVGTQVKEPIRLHQRLRGQAVARKVLDALRLVKIPAPELRVNDYPHQLSGGMRQRVSGAIALSCEPELLIADEPTTSLDVTVQAQYLALLDEIRREHDLAIIFVTHDLGIVAKMCDRVAVMYAGSIVELVPVEALFDAPAHPYTKALLAALPQASGRERRLPTIAGQPPALDEALPACPFAPRCALADRRCHSEKPPHAVLAPEHSVTCWKPDRAGSRPH